MDWSEKVEKLKCERDEARVRLSKATERLDWMTNKCVQLERDAHRAEGRAKKLTGERDEVLAENEQLRADNAKLSNRVAELEVEAARPLRRDHPALVEERRQAIELVQGFENGAPAGSESDVALTVARAALEEWDRKASGGVGSRGGLPQLFADTRRIPVGRDGVVLTADAPGVIDVTSTDQVREMIRSERALLIELLRETVDQSRHGNLGDTPPFVWLADRLEDQPIGESE